MMSASKMSLMIREKKKKLAAQHEVIDAGGSPSMDEQDLELHSKHKMTKELGLDHNEPEHEEEPEEMMAEGGEIHELDAEEEHQHEGHQASPEDAGIEEKMLKRKARIHAMMAKG